MKRAFTLVETLIASFILVIVISFCIAPFKNAIYALQLYRDRRIAENRILTVETVLKSALENCGACMPKDAASYKAAFGGKNRSPFNWNGPVSIADSSGAGTGNKLRIAYTVPTDCLADEEEIVGESAKSISLTAKPNSDYFAVDLYDKSVSVKNWVTFFGARPADTPLLVTNSSANTVTLRSKSDEVTIPRGASLMLFRALECRCMGDTFYTNDFKTSGEQPRENGICALDFEYDSTDNLLTVYVIARGDDKNLSVGKVEGASKCPASLTAQCQNKSQYVLYCEKFVFHIANLGK